MSEVWSDHLLGEVAEVVGGGTPSTSETSYWGGSIPWITPSEVTRNEGQVIVDTERTITPEGLAASSATLLPEHAVLMTSRATVGAVALTGRPMATNQGFAALVARKGVLPYYLMYWVQANRVEFESRASGSTFPEINRSKVKAVPIRLPILPVQRRIVDLIGALDAQITALNAEVLFVEAVLDRQRDALPPAQELPLGRVLTAIDSGRSVLTAGEHPVEGLPRILKISAVRPGLFSPDESKGLDTEIVMPEGSLVREGDLLITRSNTPDRVGFCARARNVPADTFMPDLIWRLRLDESLLDPDYLEQALSSPMMRSRLTSTASGTSASMRKINKQGVSTILVPIPTMEEQFTYAQTCLSISSVGLALRNEREALSLVRSTLLGSLLSGTVEVFESYDSLLEAV